MSVGNIEHLVENLFFLCCMCSFVKCEELFCISIARRILATKTLANKRQLSGNKSKFIQTAPFSLAAEGNILSLIFL